jgi:hypothetical protein
LWRGGFIGKRKWIGQRPVGGISTESRIVAPVEDRSERW